MSGAGGELDGKELVTIEGLAKRGTDQVQQAFIDHAAFQVATALRNDHVCPGAVKRNPNPTDEEISEALSGNLC